MTTRPRRVSCAACGTARPASRSVPSIHQAQQPTYVPECHDEWGWIVTPMGERLCPGCQSVIERIEDMRLVSRTGWLAKAGFAVMAAAVTWRFAPVPHPFEIAPLALFIVGMLCVTLGGAFNTFSHAREVGCRLPKWARKDYRAGRITFRQAEAIAGVRPMPLPHDRQDRDEHAPWEVEG